MPTDKLENRRFHLSRDARRKALTTAKQTLEAKREQMPRCLFHPTKYASTFTVYETPKAGTTMAKAGWLCRFCEMRAQKGLEVMV